ncbi:MAG: alpha-amylase family glycosyl hydrolase [Proteobacteria bacterium]|nr:alpha-amylase family glycosyl hydrolase [Pseudomonadota bacterium]
MVTLHPGAPWWQSAVIYQIYPRSFADASGDGVGDLQGVIGRLDHLAWLGIDAIWLSPFFRSPMRDFGYDVSDYCDVDPLFGSLDDFDALVAATHERGLRLIIDWVPAHTSSDHPWFVEARASRESPRRDWYVWRDLGANGELPNNWTCSFHPGQPAWTLDEGSGQLYLHSFLPEQPDLNWANPDVEAAMHDVLRFWLDRGVDGIRADVIHNIGKDPLLADLSPKLARIPQQAVNEQPVTHEYLRRIRALLDRYEGERMMVGEVWRLLPEQTALYYGKGDELHLNFNLLSILADWSAATWRDAIEKTAAGLDPVDAWPTWVLSNHDFPRHRTRFGGAEATARAAAILLLTLRGTPFLYMGEELGLEDAVVPPERVVDPGGRDGCRAPIPWDASADRGWGADPWLPWPPDADACSVERQRKDDTSILHLYRRTLAARRASPALRLGEQTLLPAAEGLLAYRRQCDDDQRTVLVNFRDQPARFDPGERLEIEVASDGAHEGEPFSGDVRARQALILGRAARTSAG